MEQFVEIIEKKLVYSGGTIPSENLRKALSTVTSIPKIDPLNITISVTNSSGQPIPQANVVLSAQNGTYLNVETNAHGISNFTINTRRLYSVLVAHTNYPSALFENYDPKSDLKIVLNEIENVGSIIIESTGYIPGLQGRLNPILDSIGRHYLYADNIAINGGLNQPVTFSLNDPLELEDSKGRIMNIIFRFINGRTTVLIDFINPNIE